MADKWPLAAGNWSNAANWNDGTLPVDGDTIYLDGRTITTDTDISLPNSHLRNDARSGGTAGGNLRITNDYEVEFGELSALTAKLIDLYYPTGAVLTAAIINPPAAQYFEVINDIAATATINGDLTGGAGFNSRGLVINAGTITVNGNVSGGSGSQATGCTHSGAGTLIVNGNVNAGGTFGIWSTSAGTVVVNGVAAAGSVTAINNTGTGHVVCDTCVPSTTQPAIVTGASATTTINSGRFATTGIFATSGPARFSNAGDRSITAIDADDADIVMVPASAASYLPTEANVRSGIVYAGLIGTLMVPSPAYVSLGVPTDNTVGSLAAGLDESALHAALDSYTNKADWKATGFATVNPDNAGIREAAVNSAIAAGHTIE